VMTVGFGAFFTELINDWKTLVVSGKIECDRVVVGEELLLRLPGAEYRARLDGISTFRNNLAAAVLGDQVNFAFGTSLSKCELSGVRIFKITPSCTAPTLPAAQRSLREKIVFVSSSVCCVVFVIAIAVLFAAVLGR
jgi:hypothetical protein